MKWPLILAMIAFGVCLALSSATAQDAPQEVVVNRGVPAHVTTSSSDTDPERATTVDAVTRWDTFVQALRTGNMTDAYACFSPLSRQVMSFREFCGLYSPLTAATEAVLAVPEESRFQFTGDKAVLRYVAVPREPGQPGALVQAFMVREGRNWFLVSEKRWPQASAEADARSVLRQLQQVLSLVPMAKFPASYEAFAAISPEITASPAVRLVESHYFFEIHRPDAKGWLILARPKEHAQSLRGFAMNMNGDVLLIPGTGPQPPSNVMRQTPEKP